MKCKRSRLGFELGSPYLFTTIVIIAPRAHLKYNGCRAIFEQDYINTVLIVTLQHSECRLPFPSYCSSLLKYIKLMASPVGRGYRILRLHLCVRVRSPNECPEYDTKQSDNEAPVIIEVWLMRSIPLLPSHPGPLWPGVVTPDRVLSMGQIKLFDIWNESKQMTHAKLNYLKKNWLVI